MSNARIFIVLGELRLLHIHMNEAKEDRWTDRVKKRDRAVWSRVGSDGARPCVLLARSEGVVESMSVLQLLITAL